MARCKRRYTARRIAGDAAGVKITLATDSVAFTLRAVDAASVAIAFDVAPSNDLAAVFHFVAGEGWTEEELKLDDALSLTVVSAAGSFLELIVWEG